MFKLKTTLIFVCGLLCTALAIPDDNSPPPGPASITSGEWTLDKEVATQANSDQGALLIFGDKNWKDYTLELEAQKTGGDEGFLIATRVTDPQNLVWCNFGGWGNSRTAFEFLGSGQDKSDFGDKQTYGDFQPVVNDSWHKLKIVVSGSAMEGFIDGKSACKFDAPSSPKGCVAIGTWSTQAKFRNIKVTAADGKVLWQGIPSGILSPLSGQWKIAPDVAEQTAADSPALLTFGDRKWTDYTVELEAQKTDGDEGFLVAVRFKDPDNLVWLNVGGWGNSRTAFEFANGDQGKTDFGDQQTYGDFQPVETGKWIKIKVVVSGNKAEGFIDGKSACRFDAQSLPQGCVAIGTWSTQAKFRDIKITSPDGQILWKGFEPAAETQLH